MRLLLPLAAIGTLFLCLVGFQPPNFTFPVEYKKTITLTESLNPLSAEVQFHIEIANLDDCTYEASKNGDFTFRAKVKVMKSSGTDICLINEPLSYSDTENKIRFLSTTAMQGEEIKSFIELVAFPKESSTCFGPPLSCNSPMPSCCFNFTCCDCAQWDGVLLEGFWISSQLNSTIPTIPNLSSATHEHNMKFAYPPFTPYPNYASSPNSQGCVCCGH